MDILKVDQSGLEVGSTSQQGYPDAQGLFSKQSLIFLMISFRLSIMFALVSRFAKFIPLKQSWGGTEAERLIWKRIVGIVLMILALFAIMRVVFGDNQATGMFFHYLKFDLSVGIQIILALLINSILFVGNLYYYTTVTPLLPKLYSEFEDSPITAVKTYFVAPLLEESVYCGLLFACYTQLGLTGSLNFLLSSSVCFGLSHIHMKWEDIKTIFKIPGLSIFRKIKESAACCVGLVLQTAVFSFYAKVLFLRYKNVWPCVFLHGYCNALGGPKMGFKHDKLLHLLGIVCTVSLLSLT